MEGRPSKEISSAEAVFVGALSSGVNVRTFLLMVLDYCNDSMFCGFISIQLNSVSFHCSIVFLVVQC